MTREARVVDAGGRAQPPIPVLIVDDDDAYVALLRAAFEKAEGPRIEIAHVTRLRDVLPALERTGALVVLLDVNLPDGNGLEWLRAHGDRVGAAFIVLTGMSGYAAGPELVPGARDFFLKSEVDPAQLARVLQYAADRERARQELVRSRQYFQSLIDQARDLITVVDARGTILYQSPGVRRVLGVDPEEIVGRSLFSLVDGEQAARGRALLAAALEGDDNVPVGEFSLRRAEGSVRQIEVVASRIAAENGEPRLVLNSRDVTERKRAEEELRHHDEMLRRAQRMEAVGRLAGGIAHDFNNVLSAITATCERLGDTIPPGAAAAADIQRILRNTARAAALVRQLLAFSRQQTLAPRPIDLRRLVGASADLLKPFIGAPIELSVDVAPDVRAVEADPGQIEQVLMNLAINARDAMPDGGRLVIRVQNVTVGERFAAEHPPQPPGEYVLLEVTDTGHGMDAATRDRAFEPFFTTKADRHGSGLGLSTVYGIVKQSGGHVWIDSAPGLGTTVRVYLPPTTAAPREPEPPRVHRPATIGRKTILLAEDEDDVRELIHEMLRAHGYHVLEARNPADALALASTYRGVIDLLLTDVVMPGGDGRDLARRVTAGRPETKVLYMSGYPDQGTHMGRSVEVGGPVLLKPFTRDALLQRIRELLA